METICLFCESYETRKYTLYGPTVLVNFGRFFNFLNYTQAVGLLGRGIIHCKAVTYIQNNTNTE
jgi:hypothetical protein